MYMDQTSFALNSLYVCFLFCQLERYDDTMFDRFKDPGAGAVSYHMGHDFVARYRDIEANEEVSTC